MQKWLKVALELKKRDVVDDYYTIADECDCQMPLKKVILFAYKHGLVHDYRDHTIYWADGATTYVTPRRKQKKRLTPRKCMTCRREFTPSYKFHRICDECKRTKVRDAEWALL